MTTHFDSRLTLAKYRGNLPQLGQALFLTDGGLETTLVFHQGIELPHFAAFELLKSADGETLLRTYYERYIAIAREQQVGVVLEAPTWRANSDWAKKLGYNPSALALANRKAIDLMLALRSEYETMETLMPISGNIGPRGDGYRVDNRMSADEARRYHAEQIAVFADTAADLVSAFTLNYVEEAIGVVLAARDQGMPVVISFTVETDGRLPSGMSLQQAITLTDAATDAYATYFMINCAHPTHFEQELQRDEPWLKRIRGVRANASRCSHAELDASPVLDAGDPVELGQQYVKMRKAMPQLNVLGGCCGTDHRHVAAIFTACR